MITKLKFCSDLPLLDVEQPYELFGYPSLDSGKITNCEYEVVDNIQVDDVRRTTVQPDLDATGFAFLKHRSCRPLKAADFESAGNDLDNPAVTAYLKETISLVKQELNTNQVFCLDWRFRKSSPESESLKAPQDVLDVRYQALPPGLTMHCDYSYHGGFERLEMHLQADELDAVYDGHSHAAIINAWRPFDVVDNAPLVLTDHRTVLQDDLIEVDKVLPDKVEKAYYVKHRPYHCWFYMSDQRPDELALFKIWDSTPADTVAMTPPHGAALEFSKAMSAKPRESVEMRMIVLTKAATRV